MIISGKNVIKISLLTAGLLLSVTSSTMAIDTSSEFGARAGASAKARAEVNSANKPLDFSNFDFDSIPLQPSAHVNYVKRMRAEPPNNSY